MTPAKPNMILAFAFESFGELVIISFDKMEPLSMGIVAHSMILFSSELWLSMRNNVMFFFRISLPWQDSARLMPYPVFECGRPRLAFYKCRVMRRNPVPYTV